MTSSPAPSRRQNTLLPFTAFAALLRARRPLLDLRAPVEFARGGLPQAVNLPLLDDDERHRVGLCYKQAGPEAALRLGHRIVGGTTRETRLAAWCAWADAHPDGVIYCFRGGQRSTIVQQWLSDAGRVRPRVEGGYKALRRYLLGVIETFGPELPLLVVGGRTGTGKTRILEALDRQLDLEGLAHHRGSAFGGRPAGQPPPSDFENRLALRLLDMTAPDCASLPVAIEDESRNVGRLSVPEALFRNMASAPIVLVESALEERVQLTLEDYIVEGLAEHRMAVGCGVDGRLGGAERGPIGDDAASGVEVAGADGAGKQALEDQAFDRFSTWLTDALDRIQRRLGGDRHSRLSGLLENALRQHRESGETDAHREWIRVLLADYYDPMYDHQLEKKASRIAFRGDPVAVTQWLAERAGWRQP